MSNFSTILIEWYNENKRDLPWRQTKDPYLIWISEIILQQTRVAQGYAYYQRFIARFPDLFTLAQAEEDEVLKYWQGLGYYSRARNLHAAAQQMAEMGGFPHSYKEVLSLKGVGEYTAAAICSFAYDMPHAVVDGNVYRVLSRWLGQDTPIDSTQGKKQFAQAADELLDKNQPAIYNQAIMDFGALQCTPASPNCLFCPLADSCMALQMGKVDSLPVKQHKTKVTNRYFHYFFVRAGGYTYISKRQGKDIWKNLYEFPLVETETAVSQEHLYALPVFKQFFAEGEKPIIKLVKKGVKHVLSHRVIYADFYEVVLPEDSQSFAQYQRISLEEIHNFAVPNLVYQFFSHIFESN